MTSGSAPVNNGGTAKGVNFSSVLDNLSVASTRTEKELPSTEIYAANASSLEFTNFHNDNTPISVQITDELFGSDPSLFNGVHSRVGTSTVLKFTTAIRDNRFNEYTGEWSSGYPQSTSETYGTTDSSATGAGNISYLSSNPSIVTKAYDA